MTKFIALITQPNGCDYTIACGKDWMELEACDKNSALSELAEYILGKPDDSYTSGRGGGFWEERKLSEVVLLEISDKMNVPIAEWYAVEEATREQLKQKEKERTERAAYEKLKLKYER
jgi:hypothetical protein